MNPSISKVYEENGVYQITVSGVNVSFANAIRRIILSEIPIVVINTETHEGNQCNIMVNTTRLHNEILKQRLSSIPICITELDLLPGKYVLEVDVTNETDNMMFVTTEHFRIKNKANGNYLTKDETMRIFPSNPKTNSFIDFARLRPKISDGIPGEQLKLIADFSISSAKVNSMYNVVSKCAYGNTPDIVAIEEGWTVQEKRFLAEGATEDELKFNKRNYMLLDAQRFFVKDSFDFIIQSIGIYDNLELFKMACSILQNKNVDMIQALEADTVLILTSETTMDYCYDVTLENEDYTIGKVLEYIIYEKFYVKDQTLSYCGFKKFHPHNKDSTIRLAFTQNTDRNMVRQLLKIACTDAQDLFKRIFKML